MSAASAEVRDWVAARTRRARRSLDYEPAAISLSEKALVTAWRELAAPSLRLTFDRWNATVRSEICSAWPISEVVLPRADSIKHWLSRSLRSRLRAPSRSRDAPS